MQAAHALHRSGSTPTTAPRQRLRSPDRRSQPRSRQRNPRWRLGLLALVTALVAATAIGISVSRDSQTADAAPAPLVNIYVTDGYGNYESCWRSQSGSSARYYCRDLVWEAVGYVPTAAAGWHRVESNNWTVKTTWGTVLEGCTNPTTGFTCSARARNISVTTYSTSQWNLFGSALEEWGNNQGHIASCFEAIYNRSADIGPCLG